MNTEEIKETHYINFNFHEPLFLQVGEALIKLSGVIGFNAVHRQYNPLTKIAVSF